MSTLTFGGEILRLVTGNYGDGGTAVRIITEDGEPFATLSVRMPHDLLPPGVFRVKDWSENADIAAAVIAARLVTRVDLPRIASGYVGADAYRLTDLCTACRRDMDAGEPHTAECPCEVT